MVVCILHHNVSGSNTGALFQLKRNKFCSAMYTFFTLPPLKSIYNPNGPNSGAGVATKGGDPGGYIIFRSQHLDLTHPNVRRS